MSESLKDDTYRFFKVYKNIKVIPNFVDFSLYKKGVDTKLRSRFAIEDERIITHISNFRKLKRVDDVIHIFEGIQQNISAKLLMVGEGPELEGVRALAKSKGLEDKIFFLGKSKRIEQITQISDLLLLPSETESFGLVALEAMASSVPVVSSNVGGLPEVNIDGKTGFLRPVGDIDSMISVALTILKDETSLNQFKKNALEHAKTFDLDTIVPLYEDLYRSLI